METLIKGKESIQEQDNTSKREKEDSIIDKKHNKKKPQPFKNKFYYRGDTNDKTRESDDSTSDTYFCAINLGYEQKNEEDK